MKNSRLSILAAIPALMLLAPLAQAQLIEWTGVGGDKLWSDTLNWSPNGTPGQSSTVIFNTTNLATGSGSGFVNNQISANTLISVLEYTNVAGFHNTSVPLGVTLTISNNTAVSSLLDGTLGGTAGGGGGEASTNTISGAGTLYITNSLGNVTIWDSAGGNDKQNAQLDLSGLNTFVADVGSFQIGVGGGSRAVGTLWLAATNTISTFTSGAALVIGNNSGNGAGSGNAATNIESTLELGLTNTIYTSGIEVGEQKGSGQMFFNPIFVGGANTPVVYISGGANGSRTGNFNIGDASALNSNQQNLGLVDFSAGIVNALISSCIVGDGESGGGNAAGSATGTLNIGGGTFNTSNLGIGDQTSATCQTPLTGTVNMEGSGTLIVGTTLTLANKASGATASTFGTLNATNSTLSLNNVVAGGGTSTINIVGGTLNDTNTGVIGSFAAPISNIMLSNSPAVNLALSSGASKIVGANLTAYGSIALNFTSVSGLTVFPTNIQVIVATGGPIGGTGGTVFTLGSLPNSVSATLVNDTASNSIDLNVSSAPVALGPLTWSGLSNSVTAGEWDIAKTPDWYLVNGNPSVYQNGSPVTFNDGPAGTTPVGATNITLNVTVSPSGVTFSNNILQYAVSGTGAINGSSCGVTNLGTNTVVLSESGGDSWGGGVVVSNGTLELDDANCAISGGTLISTNAILEVGNNDAGGAISLPVTDNGTLVVDRGDTALSIGVINGSGSVAFTGSGTVGLSGVQTYTGSTTVSGGGTLALSSPNVSPGGLAANSGLFINNGTVSLQADNSLAGSGVHNLPVTIGPSGTLTGSGSANGGTGTSTHLTGVLTLLGGTLAMGGTSLIPGNGVWDLQGSVVVPGTNVTSTLSALDMIPNATTSGGTAFDVTNGTEASGIDLLVSGTLINGSTMADTGFTKNGPGVMDLDNNNSYAKPTTVAGGTLELGLPTDAAVLTSPLGNGVNGNGAVSLVTGGILELNSDKGIVISNNISDDGSGVVLINGGTNIFDGTDNYSGQTIVNAGSLLVQSSGVINNSAIINVSNATLDVSASSTAMNANNTVLSLTGSTFNLGANLVTAMNNLNATNSTLAFAVNSSGTPNIIVNNLNTGGAASLVNLTAVPGFPVYPTNITLIQYSSFGNVSGNNMLTSLNLQLPSAGSPSGYLTNNTSVNAIQLVLLHNNLAPLFALTWTGVSNGVPVATWDFISSNWVQTANPAVQEVFVNQDPATFDDTVTGTTNVILNTAVAPNGVSFSNVNKVFTISGSGSIGGNGGLLMANGGKATLAESGGDTFGGGITVDAGTLVLTDANVNISGAITINGGELLDQHSGTISGNVTVGNGTLLLDQSGTISGTTTINNGMVQVGNNDANGSLPSGTLTDGSALVFDRSDSNLVVSTIISGGGAVTNEGSGKVTLGATETLTGPVIANGGTLALAAGNNASPNGISRASELVINTNATVAVAIDNSLAGHGALQGTLPIYIYPGGTLTGTNNSTHVPGILTMYGGTLADIGTPTANLFANGSWDIDDGVNVPGTNVTAVISAFCVIPTVVGGTPFNVTAGTTPSGIDLDVTGTLIHGTTAADHGIQLDGPNGGTMRMSNTNSYTGGTTINNGILIVNAPQVPGSFGPLGLDNATNQIGFGGDGVLKYSPLNNYDYSSRIQAGSTWNIDTAGQNVTFAAAITQATFNKYGAGMLTLSGANTYNGNTYVGGGTLAMTTASTGGGTFAVTNGATLDVQVASAGAQFTMSGLTNANTSTLEIDTLATGNPSVAPAISGGMTVSGTVNLQLAGTALTPATIPLVNYSGGPSPFSHLHFVPPAGFSGTLSDNGSVILVTLAYAPVPVHITGIAVNGRALTITATNGVPTGPFTLVDTTNLLLPISQWTPVLTNSFNNSGDVNMTTNVITPGNADEFYLIEQP